MRPLIPAFLAVIGAAVFTPLFGPGGIDLAAALAGDPLERQILVDLRISRVLLAVLTGGALSLAGCLFQALLRNALATPYTLGVSSGAALGAVIAICLRFPAVWLGAVSGSLLLLVLVLGFAMRQARLSPFALILAGVAASSVCSALILLLHSFAGFSQAFAITIWLIGGVDAIPFPRLALFAGVVLVLSAALVKLAPEWNLVALGDQWASARGVDVKRLMRIGYLAGSLLVAAAVSISGPIGFVGLLVPHVVRHAAGSDHRILMPCSFLYGGAFLAVCDAVGRTALAPADLPVGVVTALLGGPGLIWMLRTRAPER